MPKNIEKAFFISDLHLGHNKIAEIRGFKDAEHYFKELRQAWNDTIYEHNVVYILGDVVIQKDCLPLLGQLKGQKRFVLGNHDIFGYDSLRKYGKCYAMVVCPEQKMILTHYPVHEIVFSHRQVDWRNVHGHLHTEEIEDRTRYLNVSIETTGLSPRSYDWVERRLSAVKCPKCGLTFSKEENTYEVPVFSGKPKLMYYCPHCANKFEKEKS